jgi:hypothetical protein
MAKTSAIRQREYRQRHAGRVAELETEAAGLRRDLAAARAALEDANAEIERLSAMACKHPSAAVSGGRCQACGADVW